MERTDVACCGAWRCLDFNRKDPVVRFDDEIHFFPGCGTPVKDIRSSWLGIAPSQADPSVRGSPSKTRAGL